jgi:GT2 family glycosyltransferase
MKCSVVITTRNRCAVLKETCERLLALQPLPDEVVICADGCTDGTSEMVRQRFPTFRVIENPKPLGSVPSRDRLLRSANGDLVMSLDDDSYPASRDFFGRLPSLFAAHPEAAVICFPELRDGGQFESQSKSSSSPGQYVSAYANCAAAMRRHFYLRQHGFPPFFRHMYEEPDYALQCYAAGFAVWFEPSLVIRHHRTAIGRHPLRVHHQNARNELWSVWIRCPWPWLLIVSAYRVWRQFQFAWTQGPGWGLREPLWWFSALAGTFKCIRERRPVPWRVYLAWMRLARNPAFSFSELRRRFDSLQHE